MTDFIVICQNRKGCIVELANVAFKLFYYLDTQYLCEEMKCNS
jgi:hypothetical protein